MLCTVDELSAPVAACCRRTVVDIEVARAVRVRLGAEPGRSIYERCTMQQTVLCFNTVALVGHRPLSPLASFLVGTLEQQTLNLFHSPLLLACKGNAIQGLLFKGNAMRLLPHVSSVHEGMPSTQSLKRRKPLHAGVCSATPLTFRLRTFAYALGIPHGTLSQLLVVHATCSTLKK